MQLGTDKNGEEERRQAEGWGLGGPVVCPALDDISFSPGPSP